MRSERNTERSKQKVTGTVKLNSFLPFLLILLDSSRLYVFAILLIIPLSRVPVPSPCPSIFLIIPVKNLEYFFVNNRIQNLTHHCYSFLFLYIYNHLTYNLHPHRSKFLSFFCPSLSQLVSHDYTIPFTFSVPLHFLFSSSSTLSLFLHTSSPLHFSFPLPQHFLFPSTLSLSPTISLFLFLCTASLPLPQHLLFPSTLSLPSSSILFLFTDSRCA